MKKRHTLAISLLLGIAVVAGAFAAVRTIGVIGGTSSAAATTSEATITAREEALDQWQADLETALAKKPPELPAIPEVAAPAAPPQQVVTVQAAPAAHAGEDDDGHEYEADDHEAGHEEDD